MIMHLLNGIYGRCASVMQPEEFPCCLPFFPCMIKE